MSVIIIDSKLTKKDIEKAREDYEYYIKITIDIDGEIIALGGEYHADAEQVLVTRYNSKNKNIWGGGYNLRTKQFETNAILNLKPISNPNVEILDQTAREKFLDLVTEKLDNIEQFT